MGESAEQVTQILEAVGDGDEQAAEELLPLVYNELRRLASARMAQIGPDQSVQIRLITLAVVASPVITSQPVNQAVLEGMSVAFGVGTTSNALLSYQWHFDNGAGPTNLYDGGNVSGANTSTLSISGVSATNVGSYSVSITNSSGFTNSASATLTVLTGRPPVLFAQPAGQTVLPGATVSFSVAAAGDQPLSYAWLMGGTNLANIANLRGTATSTLTIGSANPANSGSYAVLVTNSFGSVTSSMAVLRLTGVTSAGATLETVYSFTTNSIGCLPFAGLMQASDGNFYGTAAAGGPFNYGTVFRMTTNGVLTLIRAFRNDGNGAFPWAALVRGTNGLLYGTASGGGGTVFRMTTTGGTTSFPLNPPITGFWPIGGLVQGRDGSFYGTALLGGQYNFGNPGGDGTIFKLTLTDGLSPLASLSGADGANLTSTLAQGADGNFYGTARTGGTNGNWGTILRLGPSGNLAPLLSFAHTNGADPIAGLTLDPDGNFYGTTYAGGLSDDGTAFRLSVDGTFTLLHSFNGADGRDCFAGLLLANDGNFYGATERGGAYNQGTIFRITPDGALTTLVNFDGYQGANPEGTLIQGTDDKLYGTTLYGGSAGFGAIYRLSLDGPLLITQQPQPRIAFAGDTVRFSVATFGGLPVSYQWRRDGTNIFDGGIISGATSRVLTLTNVSTNDIAAYSVVVSNWYNQLTSVEASLQVNVSAPQIVRGPLSQTVLAGATVTFAVEATGDTPLSYQWQAFGTNLVDGGNISGSTTPALTLSSVTAANAGTFAVVISNTLNSVSSGLAVLAVVPVTSPSVNLGSRHLFSGGTNGLNPYGGMVQEIDGNLYGTTLNGGTELFGTAFRLTPQGGFSVLHSFGGGLDGASPYAGLVQGSPGILYGATFGVAGILDGTLFGLATNGTVAPLYGFSGGNDGANPMAALVVGSNGKYYGATSAGGTNGLGAIFSVTTNGLFTPLWSFSGRDGSAPLGPLILGSDGAFYGTTSTGGTSELGTIFSLTTNGSLTTLATFDLASGAYPSNGLVQASDGAFYGTASRGGTNGNWGTVFRLGSDGTLGTLHSFNWLDGAYPTDGLLEGTDGALYGTTSQGGIGGQGTVFRITATGQFATLVWFNGANGANPQSSLIQARDGSFYGTTEFGGSQYDGLSGTGNGLVFRLVLPMFLSQTISGNTATVGQSYAASLTTNAIGPAGNPLTFAKVTGPAWLRVAANGALSGTPTLGDIGPHSFTVSLSDNYGWSSTSLLRITVVPAPLLLSVGLSQGTNLVLTWTGGQPPYALQTADDLEHPIWQTLAPALDSTAIALRPTNAASFYRVQSQ